VRPALTLLAALALSGAPFAGATTAPPLTLTQQAKKADVIVRASLGTAVSVQEGGVTWTVYPLTVTETIAGDPASLPQRDGKPALYLLTGVEGLPELRAGQEAFLLLYNRRLDSPVVGFTQGFYPIENGRVTRPGAATPATNASAGTAPAGTTTAAASGTAATGTTGAAAGTPGAATPGTAAPGTPGTGTAGTGTPAAPGAATGGAAGTATAPATPATTAPGATTSPATTAPAPAAATPAPTDPDPIETDPAKFRDALRAARGAS